MTITNYDKFAILPKRCDKCNRLFIWEWYNFYYKDISPSCPDLKIIKCEKCLKDAKK